jgi:rhodanese-related sulfurtransferase
MLVMVTFFIIAITSQNGSNTLTTSEFYEKINMPNAQLVDIRTSEEYRSGHIPNAVNIDFYSDTFEESFADFNPEKPIYLYCESGGRSSQAIALLEKKDFKLVYDLKDGMIAWKAAGLKIITEQMNLNNKNNRTN